MPTQSPSALATILVVDDSDLLRTVALRVLRRKGYLVLEASNAEAGLSIVLSTPLDLVISDVCMPGMSGLEMTAAMRALYPDLAVILMSGFAVDVGAVGGAIFLPKPFRAETLSATVASALAGACRSTGEAAVG
jgi:DNA-binding NtrC family response regulator